MLNHGKVNADSAILTHSLQIPGTWRRGRLVLGLAATPQGLAGSTLHQHARTYRSQLALVTASLGVMTADGAGTEACPSLCDARSNRAVPGPLAYRTGTTPHSRWIVPAQRHSHQIAIASRDCAPWDFSDAFHQGAWMFSVVQTLRQLYRLGSGRVGMSSLV
jgi:hypothetical protein